MKVISHTYVMRMAPWAIPILTLGIFLFDIFAPIGVAVSVLYVLPLLLTFLATRERDPIHFCIVATAFIWIDLLLKPQGIPLPYDVLNRALGTLVVWGVALGMIRYRQMQQGLRSAEADRADAVAKREAAVEARALSEAAATGALATSHAAKQRLLVSQLRLEGIIQSAMDAIITIDERQQIVLFNHAAGQMFQCPAQDALGQSIDRFIPGRFRDAHREHVKAFGSSGTTSRRMRALGQVSGLRADGTEFPAEAAISQITAEGNRYFTVILRDISERVRAEQLLREVEERSRLALEAGQFGSWEHDLTTGLVQLDARAQAIYGCGTSVPVKTMVANVHPDDLQALQDAIDAAHRPDAPGSRFFAEFRLRDPDGGIRWVTARAQVYFERTGSTRRAVRVIGATHDITDRKGAEAALAESERVHRTLLSNLSGMAYRCRNDKDWTMEFVSQGCEELTGYSSEDLARNRQVSFHALIHPDDRQRVWDDCRTTLTARRPCSNEYRITTHAGEEKWVWDQAQGIYGTDGSLQAIEGFITDITDRKHAAERVRQSQERYQRLIEVSPDAIFINRGDRVIFMNDQGLRLFGAVRADEVLGKSPFELFHPDCHARIRGRIHQLVHGNTIVPLAEEKIVGLDGRTVDVEVSAARFADEEGLGVLVVLRDITERKRLQEQLRKTERIAELGTVASGMAHEIGTPMNVILGRAEYLMERIKEEPIRKGLQTIVDQVERITRVMNQLLAFARRKPVERRSLDLRQTIEDNLEIFNERLAQRRIHVETSFAPSCPLVHADADQMSQVIINLVMNAIHAMPDGGTLRIGLSPGDDMVQVTVADSGQGIPQDVIARIFEPFFTTKEFGKGTGLGLTVVKGIIEEHQGAIAVDSEPGKGTIFTIQLPASSDKTVIRQ